MSHSKLYHYGPKTDVVMAFTEAAVKSAGDCVGFFHVTQAPWAAAGLRGTRDVQQPVGLALLNVLNTTDGLLLMS